jgi:hypothetical protein
MGAMAITTITCPNCHAVLNVEDSAHRGSILICDKCGASGVPLYGYHANGKSMTLCLACIQSVVGALAQGQQTPGPSEFKHVGVNPYD